MNLSFGGQLTQQDYLRAQQLHENISPRVRVAQVVVVVALVLFIPLSFALDPTLFQLILPIVLLGIFFVIFRWWLPRLLIASTWRSHKALHAPITGMATAEGIQYNSTHFKGDLAWPMFLKYKESPELVLLYQAPNVFNMVPRSFFQSDAEWRAFLEVVRQHVPNVAPGEDKLQRLLLRAFVALVVVAAIVAFLAQFLQSR